MFNLEQAITGWRRQMLAAGIKRPEHLDELESHLREELASQIQAGADVDQAFELAVKCLGQPAAVVREFAKASDARRTRLQKWMRAFLNFLGVPILTPAEFAPDVQTILENGRQEALGFHHDFIGTEHALLGLLAGRPGVVSSVLQKRGVDHKSIRDEIEKIIGRWPVQPVGQTPACTPRLRKALKLADVEARVLKQTQIRPEHVFLGLLREGGGVAARVLTTLGVDLQTARAEIARELERNQSGI